MITNRITGLFTAYCCLTLALAESREVNQIVEVLAIEEGTILADVGAGEGYWTVALGQRVGKAGRVYSTEIMSELLGYIRNRVEEAELENVTLIKGTATDTKLPRQCCDAILLRIVYHHFTNPQDMNRSLFESLRPGGLILVIDFAPGAPGTPTDILAGVPKERGGHGTPKDQLIKEMTANRFEVVYQRDDWSSGNYAVLFRRPM